MNIQQALLTRRTVHEFRDAPIDDSAIDRALAAAIRAPNHKLTNPWRFTLTGPTIRPQINQLAVELKLLGKDPSPTLLQKVRAKFGNPAHLVIISQILDDDPFRRREDFAATACAIQNFSLSLWGEGIASKWSTGAVTRHPKTYQLAGINPDIEEIVGFVFVGVPAQIPDPPRLPLAEVTRRTK